jgi:hypothetical protein
MSGGAAPQENVRPPLAQDRLHVSAEGTIWLTLRHRWADGTTHLHPTAHNTRGGDPGLRFDPLELRERLAVLTPRPRVNLILYYGVLAPRAAWRGHSSPGRHTVSIPRTWNRRRRMTRTRCAPGRPGPVPISGPS